MRPIPVSLRTKLLNRCKADATNSKPSLRLVATQTSVNTLLSEPIHEDVPAALGDVAVRQMEGDADLALAYAICLDDGIARVYKRQFPAGFDFKWEYQWTLGAAQDVAMEYNGVWKMNPAQEWYFLQTEAFPYIFYVQDGELFVQNWTDAENKLLLASGVTQISACKGWQSSIDTTLDQGLMIGYLREGSVYYRAYCMQSDGSMLWEVEQPVTELGTGNSTLSLFRTNDFRIGFLTQNGTDMLLALSRRNYAGMSVRPETVHIHSAKARIWMPDILQKSGLSIETARTEPAFGFVLLDENPASDEITVTSVEKLNRPEGFSCYGFKLVLSKPLFGEMDADFLPKCKVSAAGVAVIDSQYSTAEQALILLTDKDIRRTMEVTITIPQSRSLWYFRLGQQKWFLPVLSPVAAAETMRVDGYTHETISVATSSAVGRLDVVVNHLGISERCAATITTPTATVTLTPASTLPI